MSIYITGSTGSIGRHIPNVKSLSLNLLEDKKKFQQQFKSFVPDVLIHLAAITDNNEINKNPEHARKVNVLGTMKLFESYSSNGGKKFIYISSGHVYGKTDFGRFSEENDLLNPLTKYAEQKIAVESYLAEKSVKSGTQIIILRLFSVAGPGMAEHYLASNILKSKSFEPIRNALDVRDFLPVSKAAKMIYAVAETSSHLPLILNVCSGVPSRIKDKVFELCPSWPRDAFIHSHSELPWLVGNPSLFMNSLQKIVLKDKRRYVSSKYLGYTTEK